MFFRQLRDPASGALAYLIADADAGEAAAIDPRPADAALLRALLDERGLRLAWVLRTHAHAGDARDDGLAPLARIGPDTARDTDCLPLGGDALRVLATPGHTGACVSYLWRDRLFCGDALSFAACDRGPAIADAGRLWDSVTRRIFALPPETLLYPAHVPADGHLVASVADQRLGHPAFARRSRDDFLAWAAGLTGAG